MITFNSFNLTGEYIVTKINKSDAPTRDVFTESLAFQDGFEFMNDFWKQRTITIEGTIDATSQAHLDTLKDTIKQNLSGSNKNLDVDHGGGTRRYKATLEELTLPEDHYNITHIPFVARFTCKPFGYDTTTTSFTASNVTASSYTDTMTVSGTYRPLPIITITFDSVDTATKIEFTNTTTGDAISISSAFSASDVIIINTETQKATLNGANVDFEGPIPLFETGSNSIQIDVTSISHQYDLDITYTARYL